MYKNCAKRSTLETQYPDPQPLYSACRRAIDSKSGALNVECRSEFAREKPKTTAGRLTLRVIVHDLRERARAYRGRGSPTSDTG